jgi:hypothetical protein
MLFGTIPVPLDFNAKINGQIIPNVHSPNANSHFQEVSLIGYGFCSAFGATVTVNYETKTATMEFPPSF